VLHDYDAEFLFEPTVPTSSSPRCDVAQETTPRAAKQRYQQRPITGHHIQGSGVAFDHTLEVRAKHMPSTFRHKPRGFPKIHALCAAWPTGSRHQQVSRKERVPIFLDRHRPGCLTGIAHVRVSRASIAVVAMLPAKGGGGSGIILSPPLRGWVLA